MRCCSSCGLFASLFAFSLCTVMSFSIRACSSAVCSGKENFGFDPIFQPDGKKKTLSQMGKEKHNVSHRGIAWRKFKDFLEKN